jgi:hypothetical protein
MIVVGALVDRYRGHRTFLVWFYSIGAVAIFMFALVGAGAFPASVTAVSSFVDQYIVTAKNSMRL